MPSSHKHTIEQLTELINARHVNHLDKVLADNVKKIDNTKTIFTNLQEAREYYSMEHEANPKAEWKVIHVQEDNQNNDTAKATITFNNHTYNTEYTFDSNGKIQTIHANLEQHEHEQ